MAHLHPISLSGATESHAFSCPVRTSTESGRRIRQNGAGVCSGSAARNCRCGPVAFPPPFPQRAFYRLSGGAIARVAAVVPRTIMLLIPQVVGELSVRRSFQQRLREVLQQAAFADDVLWLFVPLQQLVNQLGLDLFHAFSSSIIAEDVYTENPTPQA